MCSLAEDNITEETNEKFMPEKPDFILDGKLCNKCRQQEPKVVLRNKDAYCKTCFLQGTLHKFKALLGKHRFVNANERVLVIHRGGHPSTALLHFLRSGLDLSTPKKMRIEPLVLFIECHYDSSVSERWQILREINREVKAFNFPIYYISLAEYVLKTRSIMQNFNEINLEENDKSSVMTIISQQASLSTEQEILRIFESQLIVDIAKQLKCKCVFIPELAIDVASKILTNVSLGRGSHLPLDVGVCDSRDPAVKIIRPLRLYDMKELAFYNIFNNLSPVVFMQIPRNQYSSVQNLMKEFVCNLQSNYPATINTIVRTSDKLSLDKNIVGSDKCSLCQVPVENKSGSITSAESTSFSHWLSTQTPNYKISPEERYCRAVNSFNQSSNPKYCFACSRIEKYLIKP